MSSTAICEIGTITDSRGNLLLKMWTVGVPAGKRLWARHRHISFEIMIVNSGSGSYTTEHAEYPISCGDVFVFSSNEVHCITNVGAEGLHITNLQFEPRYLWGASSDSASVGTRASAIDINFCFSHSKEFSNRILSKQADGQLAPLLRMIQNELSARAPEFALSVRSLLTLLLITLIRDYGYLDASTNVSREHVRSIQRTLAYIDRHFTEQITLQDLSDLAGLSPNYFSALFKQISGITLWNYISAKRIDRAVRLITDHDTKANMLQIAIDCGFNNTANFNKVFKKVTGMTPSEYRRNGQLIIS